MYDFDVIVIGGGSGGLVAARLAAGLGARVALIEKERLGGDCLHYGCVPSKTLIQIAKVAQQIRRGTERGVVAPAPEVQMPLIAATIAGVIEQIGADEQVYVENVTVHFGQAQFRDPHTLLVNGAPLTARAFIIATGSRPALPDLPGLAEAGVWTNEDLFDLHALPAALVVLGGGPVGCEMAQAFARLGSQVTLLQRAERLLPREEPEVSQAIHAALANDGVRIITGAQVAQVRRDGDQRTVTGQRRDGTPFTASGAAVLVAAGRAPNVEGLALDRAGVAVGPKGITVDGKLRTSAKHVFAIGDVIGGYLFTHVAAAQGGIAGVNAILPAPLQRTMKLDVVPWATFTDPEAARVGLTEVAARQRFGNAMRVVSFPWAHIDRAQAEGETAGFIKLILTGKKDHIAGAHLVGAHAGELLGELALAMRHGLTAQQIATTIHAYPTLATGLQQATFEAYLTSRTFAGYRRLLARFLPRRSER
jgi:pyruvate/2-oxoglutarate dehydrogenase complex dihydrolipoamide dehydrogenase (E3) component